VSKVKIINIEKARKDKQTGQKNSEGTEVIKAY
jgi:hypothetical protein